MFMNMKMPKIIKSLLIILSLVIIIIGGIILYKKSNVKEELRDRVVLNDGAIAYNKDNVDRALNLIEDLKGLDGEEYELLKDEEILFENNNNNIFKLYKDNESYGVDSVQLDNYGEKYFIYGINSKYYKIEESETSLEFFKGFYNEFKNIRLEPNIKFMEEVEDIYLKAPALNMRDMKLGEENFKRIKSLLIEALKKQEENRDNYEEKLDNEDIIELGNEKYILTLNTKDSSKKINLYNDYYEKFYTNFNFENLISSKEMYHMVEEILSVDVHKENLNYILLAEDLKIYVDGKEEGSSDLGSSLKKRILEIICNGNFHKDKLELEMKHNIEIGLKIKGEEVKLKVLSDEVIFNDRIYEAKGVYNSLNLMLNLD
ncbi:hypothetical protein [Clostridium sp.]|uniref:hypothetical protein n=1 Tax=Clostridium sp. TaxID=1506 RepID=UPI003463A19D